MRKTRLFWVLTWPLVILFGYLLFDSIYSKIEEDRKIKESERLVVSKLKIIREAQKEFIDKYEYYTSTWDSLRNFIATDTIYAVAKKEVVIPARKIRTDANYYLGDSILVSYDTLGKDVVMDRLKAKYGNFDVSKLEYVPALEEDFRKDYKGNPVKFIMNVEFGEKSGVPVWFIEVIDPAPIDLTRRETHDNIKRRFLRFGSLQEFTISGNWSDIQD
ncbi:MAG: hypothetical protein JJT94_17190 [Bernardetiaceae bacterium]|nr:hypothetical protein [Bernardetiaceae bacterium]